MRSCLLLESCQPCCESLLPEVLLESAQSHMAGSTHLFLCHAAAPDKSHTLLPGRLSLVSAPSLQSQLAENVVDTVYGQMRLTSEGLTGLLAAHSASFESAC